MTIGSESMNGLLIATELVRSDVEEQLKADTPVEELARMAFKAALNGSNMFTLRGDDKDQRFRIGLAVVKLLARPEDQPRVESELKKLRALSSVLTGGGSLESLIVEVGDDRTEPIGFLKIFEEEDGSEG